MMIISSKSTSFSHPRQTKRWRRKYIRSMVSLAGAWGGTVASLDSLLRKDINWDHKESDDWDALTKMVDVPARHIESPYWLMPTEDAFGDEIVATLNLTTRDGNPKVGCIFLFLCHYCRCLSAQKNLKM